MKVNKQIGYEMDINDITLGQAKELAAIFCNKYSEEGIGDMIGKKCIIRTYSAGVWFGTVAKKSGGEVIVTNARRMWKWHASDGISLSCVAVSGISQSKSRIAVAVDSVWIEAIEIIPASEKAIKSIEGAGNATA